MDRLRDQRERSVLQVMELIDHPLIKFGTEQEGCNAHEKFVKLTETKTFYVLVETKYEKYLKSFCELHSDLLNKQPDERDLESLFYGQMFDGIMFIALAVAYGFIDFDVVDDGIVRVRGYPKKG
jgi:hypothetical protein